jgi:sporulation protein YlmC with PRC-barrel domain
MISKTIAAAVLTTVVMTGVTSAQTTTANKADAAGAGATLHREGGWRASKLVGVNVYNKANEKIGGIDDVILDKSGKASKVILGVGGFLGMGEHNVAMKWNEVKFVSEPVKSASTTTTTSRNTVGSGATTTTRTTVRDYPDHAMVNSTKDQLKAMPQFKYPSDTK